MVKPTSAIISLTVLSLLTVNISISIPSVRSQLSVSPILTACPGLRRSSKIQVYVQDPLQGANETAFPVTNSSITATSPSEFGVIRVADNKLTAGSDCDSQEVGRAQGTVTDADSRVYAISMAVNFYFTAGIYNGSTIGVSGRNQEFPHQQNRELAVVGGTGIFRCARGYATATTYSVDPATFNGVYLYTFYINYYQNI